MKIDVLEPEKLINWSDIERALGIIADERERRVLALDAIYDLQREVWQRARDLKFTCAAIAVPSRVTRANVQAQTDNVRGEKP